MDMTLQDLGEPTHTLVFFVGCLNPCLQGTNVHVGSPQPHCSYSHYGVIKEGNDMWEIK